MDDPLALVLIRAGTAELAGKSQLSDEGKAALLPGTEQTPRQLLDALLRAKKFADALKLLANGLPIREGIWWAALCFKLSESESASPADRQAALRAVTSWLLEPTEENRRLTSSLVKGNTAEDYLCRAVAWTGGSLTPPNLPVVPPKPDMPLKALAGAVQLAAVSGNHETIDKRFRHFLTIGIRIARGKYPLPQASAQPAPSRPDHAPLHPPGHPSSHQYPPYRKTP